MDEKLIIMVKEEFEKIISVKTGWGKNEVIRAFDTAVSSARLRMADNEGKKTVSNTLTVEEIEARLEKIEQSVAYLIKRVLGEEYEIGQALILGSD